MKPVIAVVLVTLAAPAAQAYDTHDPSAFETRLVYPPPPPTSLFRRQGLTLELALGAHYTNVSVDAGNHVAGVLAGSVGVFREENFAWLLHVAGSNTSEAVSQTVIIDGVAHNGSRSHSITTLFIGPQAQWFPASRLMFAAGLGAAELIDAVRLDVRGDHQHGAHGALGIGASLRGAVTIFQRRESASLRLGLEALPSYIAGEWRTSVGLMGELQVF